MIMTHKLILSLFLTLILFTAGLMISEEAYALWYGPNWGYRQMISIDSTQVPGDLANFPVLVRVTDANLRVSPSGDVGRANGGDILFTSADGITKLDHEIESYNSATGELIAWVEVPFVSSTADTVLYMYYGNAGAANQWNINGTWNSNYAGVWHLSEDPSGTAPQMQDSTSNNNDGTSNGGMTSGDQVAGQVDGSLDFDGSGDFIDVGNDNSLMPTSALTVEAWVSRTGGLANWETVLMRTSNDNWDDGYGLGNHNNGSINFWVHQWSNNRAVAAWPTGWHYVVGTYDGTNIRIFVDGAEGTSDTFAAPFASSNNSLHIGAGATGGGNATYFYGGRIDEVRISDIARSADWIETSYNNQNNPPFFLSFGAPEMFVPVPSMTQWGMIIFMMLTGLGAIYYLRRQRTV